MKNEEIVGRVVVGPHWPNNNVVKREFERIIAVNQEWHSDGVFSGMPTNGHEPDEILTAQEAAAYLKLTLRQFRVLDQQGRFPRLDYGKKSVRYLRSDLIQAGKL